MNKIVIHLAAVMAITAGLAMAQGPGFGCCGRNFQAGTQNMTDWRLDRLSGLLNLTDSQKQHAKLAFDTAFTATQALAPAIQQAQAALREAATTGKGDVDKLAADLGALLGKVRALHTKALAQVYNILTPAQREQFDKFQGTGLCMGLGTCPRGSGMGMMGRGFGPGARP